MQIYPTILDPSNMLIRLEEQALKMVQPEGYL